MPPHSVDAAVALALVTAIRTGDVAALRALLAADTELANVRIPGRESRMCSALHVATDWPGHFPNGAAVVVELVGAGADPNITAEAAGVGERPLQALHRSA